MSVMLIRRLREIAGSLAARAPLVRRLRAERDAAMAACDAALGSRTALIGALVRASEPGAFFRAVLNGAAVWLPRDTLRTMVHCVHLGPDNNSLLLYVEVQHLEWMIHHLGAGGTFLDVGAATGATTLPIAIRKGASVSVIAYEPARRSRQLLLDTLAKNDVNDVEVRSVAVSDAASQADFCEMPFDDTDAVPYMPEMSSLSAPHVAKAATATYTVTVTTLDDDMASRTLREPIVAKIDVEGFEVHVLRGAAKLIERHRPYLSIDIHRAPFGTGETTEGDCRAILGRWGYSFENMGHVLLCSPVTTSGQ